MPNPFRTTADVEFSLKRSGRVGLKLYDIEGRCLTTLKSGTCAPGMSSFILHRSSFAPGVYLLRLETPEGEQVKKIVVEE